MASSSTLGPPLSPCVLASSSGSWPVTFTVIPAGSSFAAAPRMRLAPLLLSNFGDPGG